LRGQARVWQELASIRDAFDLAWTAQDSSLFALILIGRAVPSIKDRFEIRASVLAALRGDSYSGMVNDWISPARRNWWRNLGAEAGPKNPAFEGHLGAGDQWLCPDTWKRDPTMLIYLKRFLELAAARDIAVFWLVPPIAPEAQALCDQKGLTAQLNEFVSSAQARFPNLVVLDARHSGYQHTVFQNPPHLDLQGAFALTTDLATILVRYFSETTFPTRRVDFPLYRDRPIPLPLEDVNQSRIALRAGQRG
jgi:hypothetical protein